MSCEKTALTLDTAWGPSSSSPGDRRDVLCRRLCSRLAGAQNWYSSAGSAGTAGSVASPLSCCVNTWPSTEPSMP